MLAMVAAVSTLISHKTAPQNGTRPPHLRSSEPDNGVVLRRTKSRDVPSRYLTRPSSSSSTSSSSSWTCSCSSSSCASTSAKKCHSSLISRTNLSTPVVTPATGKRSQSVERRRAGTPRPDSSDSKSKSGVSAAQRMLFTSAKSLSVSFQGEAFSLQLSKTKPSPSPSSVRRGTPERMKTAATPASGIDRSENSNPSEQQHPHHPWPRSRQTKSITRNVDYTEEGKKLGGSGKNVVRALQNSILHNRASSDGRLPMNLSNNKKEKVEFVSSDTESVSSGSTTSGSLVSVNNGLKKFGVDTPISSLGIVNNRVQLSPMRGPSRPVSPGKLATPAASNPSRGMSPSKGRKGVVGALSSNLCNTPSILSFAADVRRANIGENRMADAHSLRLFHNTLLQWRLVNARGDAVLSVQKSTAERSLYNAWRTISRLHDSVKEKRTELQLLQQNLKLVCILKGQVAYLEEWAKMDQDHSASLLGAIEALKASTIRLPIVGGAKANAQSLKDAICSAVDVMHAMESSVCLFLSEVGEVSSLATELINVTAKEHAMVDQCKGLLSTIGAIHVTECSLRTHTLQLQHLQTNRFITKV